MNQLDINTYGCPLRYQTGETAVKDFATLIEQMPDELRDAFETEREEREYELYEYVSANGYMT